MDQVRHQLVTLCRRSAARQLGFPRDWRPNQVMHPHTGEPFTERGAWEFVAEELEAGHTYEVLILDNPRGATAYVLLIAGGSSAPPIYVKLQLGSGCVIGRSFHYSHC